VARTTLGVVKFRKRKKSKLIPEIRTEGEPEVEAEAEAEEGISPALRFRFKLFEQSYYKKENE
jgi:hypothetical protein